MARLVCVVILVACLLYAGGAFAQGACPSGVPASKCYFIAASGSDSNAGTDESHPWAHAPGMPNCSGNCAATQTAWGGNTLSGIGIIFRGGDTWHFGNSSATPYVGGNWFWGGENSGTLSGGASFAGDGVITGCDMTDNPNLFSLTTTCVYIGVDKNWYTGSSWSRPIFTGDNPLTTHPGTWGDSVSSCAYRHVGSNGTFLTVNNNRGVWFDNFEFTGLCTDTPRTAANNYLDAWFYYIYEMGAYDGGQSQNRYSNMYFHGSSHPPISCTDDGQGNGLGQCGNEQAINGSGYSVFGPGNVVDGGDSDPGSVGALAFGPGYIVYDNVFYNQAQIVVNGYHVWHDNVWQNYRGVSNGHDHGNEFESNTDANNTPFNVWYNNVQGHTYPESAGGVKVWFCPNSSSAEYWFNNIQYDQTGGNLWDIATSGFNCTDTGSPGMYQFNNTLDEPQALDCRNHHYVTGNHEISESGSVFGTGGPCTVSNEVVMSHATAVKQGYAANGKGTSGYNNNVTCANDVAPCVPTASTNSTVGSGAMLQNYCTALMGSSALEIERAGNACMYGTTDACSYDTTTHTVSCPHNAPVARTASAAWDAGAYQFSTSKAQAPQQAPQPPSNLTVTVH